MIVSCSPFSPQAGGYALSDIRTLVSSPTVRPADDVQHRLFGVVEDGAVSEKGHDPVIAESGFLPLLPVSITLPVEERGPGVPSHVGIVKS